MSALDMPRPADEPAWVDDVLRFWFTELTLEQCFEKNDEVDRQIGDRFGVLHEQLAEDDSAVDVTAPRELLAAIIVFDQFPRNLYRSTARAVRDRSDRAAPRARRGGPYRQSPGQSRAHLRLPAVRAQRDATERTPVALFAALDDPELDKYALAHKVIIDRFGRFPHRNAALGRVSTPEEVEFLKQPMSSF